MTRKELNKRIKAYEKFMIDCLNNLFINDILTEKQYKSLWNKIIEKIQEINDN